MSSTDTAQFAFYTLQIKDTLMEVAGVERLAIGTQVALLPSTFLSWLVLINAIGI